MTALFIFILFRSVAPFRHPAPCGPPYTSVISQGPPPSSSRKVVVRDIRIKSSPKVFIGDLPRTAVVVALRNDIALKIPTYILRNDDLILIFIFYTPNRKGAARRVRGDGGLSCYFHATSAVAITTIPPITPHIT